MDAYKGDIIYTAAPDSLLCFRTVILVKDGINS